LRLTSIRQGYNGLNYKKNVESKIDKLNRQQPAYVAYSRRADTGRRVHVDVAAFRRPVAQRTVNLPKKRKTNLILHVA